MFFLHKTAKLIFVQNSPAQTAQNFCIKTQNSISCRIRQPKPSKTSAQKRKTHFRAEFASKIRPNLLHKNAKLNFVQNFPAETAQIFCTKIQIPISCRIPGERRGHWWREASQKGARRRMASQVHRKARQRPMRYPAPGRARLYDA